MWQAPREAEVLALWHVERIESRLVGNDALELLFLYRHKLRGVSPVNEPLDASPSPPLPDIMWAPWRMEYILNPERDGCFLCSAVASDDDHAHFVVERREACFSILNRFPYNNGHLLVAPNAHKAALADLTDSELCDLMRLTRDTQERLERAVSPHGFNIGINLGRCAGAGVPGHLHVHIVPRWDGDTNFMPVTAKTKVIVQSLGALYRLLREPMQP